MSPNRPPFSPIMALIVLIGMFAWPAIAQAELKLLINKDDTVGRFVIDGDVDYDVSTGVVSMDVFLGQSAAGADNPLFCFDFASQEETVKLDIMSGSQTLAEKLKLTSALQYQLTAQTIEITPSADVACFFRAYDEANDQLGTDFGLYGETVATASAETDVIFHDDFAGVAELNVAFSNSTPTGGGFQYDITVTNNSAFALDSLAFQQAIPAGLEVANEGVVCQVNGANNEAVCTAARKGTLRYEGFTLAAGESLELAVTATGTAELTVYAAVATPTSSGTTFAVDQLTLTPDP